MALRKEPSRTAGQFFYYHPSGDCELSRYNVADTAEAIEAWNRRTPSPAMSPFQMGQDAMREAAAKVAEAEEAAMERAALAFNGITNPEGWQELRYLHEQGATVAGKLAAAIRALPSLPEGE